MNKTNACDENDDDDDDDDDDDLHSHVLRKDRNIPTEQHRPTEAQRPPAGASCE